MQDLWSNALPLLRNRLGERNYSVWIEPIRAQADGEGVRLEVASQFCREWIAQHFLSVIRDTLTHVAGEDCAVRLSVNAAPPPPGVLRTPSGARPPARERCPRIGVLIGEYRFERLVVGRANEMVVREARRLSAAPGRRFNPFLFHGGVGLGKTHIANAIGHDLLRRWGRLRIACLPAEPFINDLIHAMRTDRMNSFRERFRKVDVFILDDVQFFAGKERTQEEFFHTFNALYASGTQFVFTADKPPSAITGLEDRLRSRFEGGLIAEIQPPDREMREQLVRERARALGIELADGVVAEIVAPEGLNVRELQGVLNRVVAETEVNGRGITVEMARAALGPLRPRARRVSIEEIQRVVGKSYGIEVRILASHRRDRKTSGARQVAMYLCRGLTGLSYSAVGEAFGDRDHATVMHAVRMVEKRRRADTELDRTILGLEAALKG